MKHNHPSELSLLGGASFIEPIPITIVRYPQHLDDLLFWFNTLTLSKGRK
jgi:hypothetical protein